MRNYQNENIGILPEKIVVYRDGIGGPTLMQKCMNYEVRNMIQAIERISPDYKPRVLYNLIDKMTNHRLFMKSNGDVWNPGPGTVLDSSLVEN